MSYDAFTRKCTKDFAFLVREWGFELRASANKLAASVSFSRPDARVGVYAEWMNDPWVTVTIGGREEWLDAKISKLDPELARRKPSGESAVIAYYARFFREHAGEILEGLPREAPPAAPPKKPRPTIAGPLDFLSNELGWGFGRMLAASKKQTTWSFFKDDVRLMLAFDDAKRLKTVRIRARKKEADLDDAIALLAPDLPARPKDQKARLAFYAEFLRTRGEALLAGARSAWSRL